MLQQKRLSDDFAEHQNHQSNSSEPINEEPLHQNEVKSAELAEDLGAVNKKDSMRNVNEDGSSSGVNKEDQQDAIDDDDESDNSQ